MKRISIIILLAAAASAVREEYEAARGKDFKFIPLMDRRPPLDMNVR